MPKWDCAYEVLWEGRVKPSQVQVMKVAHPLLSLLCCWAIYKIWSVVRWMIMTKQLGIWTTALLVVLLSFIKLPPQERMAPNQPLGVVTEHYHQKLDGFL